MQLILARLRREPYNAGRPIHKAKALKALDYFGVPEALWPHGLQLLRRAQQSFTLWQERDQQAIKEIVQQICSQMAVPSVEKYPRPQCDKVEAVSHHMDFEATKYDPLTGPLHACGESRWLSGSSATPPSSESRGGGSWEARMPGHCNRGSTFLFWIQGHFPVSLFKSRLQCLILPSALCSA